jgi:SpoVK/Ycf46/Vps4 family AAA+-type ATPase
MFEIENIKNPLYYDMKGMYDRGRLLFKTEPEPQVFFHISFYGDDRLVSYLSAERCIDAELEGIATFFGKDDKLPPILTSEEIFAEIKDALLTDRNAPMIIKGDKGVGKKFLIKQGHQYIRRGLLMIDSQDLLETKKIKEKIRLIMREALFRKCGVCLHRISKKEFEKLDISSQNFVKMVVVPFIDNNIPVYLCCDLQTDLLLYMPDGVRQFKIEHPVRKERIRLWEGYGEYYEIEIEPVDLGTKYKFTPGEIDRACRQLKANGVEKISETLSEIMPPVFTKGTIEPYHPNCTLDDLVVSDDIRQKINEICAYVWYSSKVYDEWNLESKYAYGKAVSVLLSGPPGTGKTMTARVIADMLKLPLYRVNLSQLVDKYIGETEKHLEEIFTNAEQSNLILFFDEADAVFSKRSEVNDSKDKYANTEVSYILQRIESYEGIVILATNYKSNIDNAFMRRMKYIISFQLPNKDERLELWKGCFTNETPLCDIDYEYLAEQFEFSPSTIKNVVLTASFVAASEDSPIEMRHIIGGIKNEYEKSGKPVLIAEFGRYADLL